MQDYFPHHKNGDHSKTGQQRNCKCSPRPLSVTSCFWIFIIMALSGIFLGKSRAKSNVLGNLVSEYLRDEGQLTIEGRTIIYKAYVQDLSFPPVFEAEAQDVASGIKAKAQNFDDAQDAYQKAVANLLAILRERGLMKKYQPHKAKGVKTDSAPLIQEAEKPLEPNLELAKPELKPSPSLDLPPEKKSSEETNSELRTGQDEKNPTSGSKTNQGTKTEQNVNQQEPPEQTKRGETNPGSHSDPDKKDSMLGPETDKQTEAEKNQDLLPEHQKPPQTNSESQMDPSGNLPVSEHKMDEDIQTKQDPEWEFETDPKLDNSEDTGSDLKQKLDHTGSRGPNYGENAVLTNTLSGAVGVVIAASAFYIKDWGILKTGAVIVGVFLLFKIAMTKHKRIVRGCQRGLAFVLGLMKSAPNILNAVWSAGFVLDVFPDYQGSYAAYSMREARPTEDMLMPKDNYKLWSKCKGLAFVLNNTEFDRGGNRSGAEIDQGNMVHLFRELGYTIFLHKNLKGQDIKQSFRAFVAKFSQDGACYDSAVVILMSHGNTGVILGTDLVQVKLVDLERQLEGDRCPGLKDKPKMFFVQACRGPIAGRTPVVPVSTDSPNTSGTNEEISTSRDRFAIPRVEPDDLDSKLQDVADVYLAFATTDGFYSLRSDVIGSFFVQALCEVFFANAHRDNLDTLMNKITDRVRRMKGRMYDNDLRKSVIINETPEIIRRTCKAIYFLPKYAKN